MVYYEMTDGAGRMVAIENRSGIGWVNKVDWDRGLISDPWSTNSAAEVEARKMLEYTDIGSGGASPAPGGVPSGSPQPLPTAGIGHNNPTLISYPATVPGKPVERDRSKHKPLGDDFNCPQTSRLENVASPEAKVTKKRVGTQFGLGLLGLSVAPAQ